jgi:hypothetical protein
VGQVSIRRLVPGDHDLFCCPPAPRPRLCFLRLTTNILCSRRGSPNIEMDEHTFLTNRERAVDYLNSLDKVFVNDQFLNWDPENRIKVRIISARAYHSLFMHNM